MTAMDKCVISPQPHPQLLAWLLPHHHGVAVGRIKLLLCFCSLDILPVQCLPPYYRHSGNMYFCPSCPRFVCSYQCCTSVSSANDGSVTDFYLFFYLDLFTAVASITAFVVVIKFLLPGPLYYHRRLSFSFSESSFTPHTPPPFISSCAPHF